LAEAAARRLLQRIGWAGPPTNPLAIASELGIIVEGSANLNGSFSGCLMLEGDTFGILYSTSIPSPGFQRFTVGHELGHHQIRRHRETLFATGRRHFSASNFTSNVWHEIEADHFSAELLMPEGSFRSELGKLPVGAGAIKALADLFVTSWTSTAIRYATLSPDPVAIVVSQDDRVCYCFRSGALRQVPGTEIRPGDNVPPGTLTRDFNADRSNVSRRAEGAGKTPLNVWCPGAREGPLMTEHVIGLGSYGRTLTVLHTSFVPGDDIEH